MIYEFYGATEGGGTLAQARGLAARTRAPSGRRGSGADVKVLDDDGNEVPAGHRRHRVPEADGASSRYKGDPEKTAANRHGDYFTVGDMGELDDEGFLYLRDRKIDMIISGGVNIYPAEVEAALLVAPRGRRRRRVRHPARRLGRGGQGGGGAGGRASSRRPRLADELLAHCEAMLARYKCPRSIDFTDAMPRDPNGKLYKRTLRDPYWVGRERADLIDRRLITQSREESRAHGPSAHRGGVLPHPRRSRRAAACCSGAGARAAARCSSRAGWCARSACTRAPTTSSCRRGAGSGPGRTATCRCSGRRTPTCRATASARSTCPEGPRMQAILLGGPGRLRDRHGARDRPRDAPRRTATATTS